MQKIRIIIVVTWERRSHADLGTCGWVTSLNLACTRVLSTATPYLAREPLSRAAERALPADGKTSMSEELILSAVGALYRERMVKRVGADTVAYLEAVLRAVAPAVEFRAADLARVAGVSRARATQVVDKLLERKVVRRSRTEQASKYLVPTGEMQVALEAVLRISSDAHQPHIVVGVCN